MGSSNQTKMECSWDASLRRARMADVLSQVAVERERQQAKWGEQNHPDGTGQPQMVEAAKELREICDRMHGAGKGTWMHILNEEVGEAFAEVDSVRLRKELIEVAAVAVAWVEAIERRWRHG